MPTYSYRCQECGDEFDIVQSFSDDPLTVCPRCDGPLRKLFNAVGVVFKGSGFYRTDSRGSSTSSSTTSTSSADSSPATGGSGTSTGSSSPSTTTSTSTDTSTSSSSNPAPSSTSS